MRFADLDAFDVVLDRPAPHRRVGMRQAAEFVRQRLAGLVLERVRVHRVEVKPALGARTRAAPQVVGLVPRDMERDRRRRAHELEDRRAVVELFEDVARLACPGKSRETRAAGADAPRRHGDLKRRAPASVRSSMSTPRRRSLLREVLEVLVEPRACACCFARRSSLSSISKVLAAIESSPIRRHLHESVLQSAVDRDDMAGRFATAASKAAERSPPPDRRARSASGSASASRRSADELVASDASVVFVLVETEYRTWRATR